MRSGFLRDGLFRVMRLGRSVMSVRFLRAFRRCEVGLDWRWPDRGLILDTGEVLGFVAMHLQGGEEFRVVVLHRETEMRPLVVLDHFGIIAAVDSCRARHSAGAVV